MEKYVDNVCPKCGTELIILQIDGEQRLACFKYGLSCDYVVPKETQAQLESVITNVDDKPSDINGSDTIAGVKSDTAYYDGPVKGDTTADNTKLYRKPPLGVIPKKLWIEDRIQNLTRAMHEYAEFGDYRPIKIWADELVELIEKVGE